MTKILLIGSRGQIGRELEKQFSVEYELIALGRPELDLCQENDLADCIESLSPDYIVNAAAYTAVDRAEKEPELARQINTIAPAIMAKSAKKIKASLLHISTDYVFDGKKNTPYLENDPTNPLNVYGLSKRDGEEMIRSVADDYIILRTSWVYGSLGKGNFVKSMLTIANQRDILRVVDDQIGCPTWSSDIAQVIGKIITKKEHISTGIYHFTGSGETSWYGFALYIFQEAKKLGFPLTVHDVIPISTQQYPTLAIRPAYSVLSNDSLSECLGISASHWQDSLPKMLEELRSII